jgi:hypothetical protein
MIWIFERGNEILRLETRYDKGTSEYVLIVHHPDRSHQTERFNDSVTFQAKLDSLGERLRSENWRDVGAPVLPRVGWKL